MSKKKIRAIMLLMAVALLGIVSLQTYSIMQAIRLNEGQFDKNALAALNRVVERLEQEEVEAAATKYDINLEPSPQLLSMKVSVEDVYMSLNNDTSVEIRYSTEESLPPDSLMETSMLHTFSLPNAPACNIDEMQRDITTWFVMRSEVAVEDRLQVHDLDRILREELHEKGINLSFYYGVYSAFRNAFVRTKKLAPGQEAEILDLSDYTNEEHLPELRKLRNSPYRMRLFPASSGEPGMLMLFFPDKGSYLMSSVWLHLLGTLVFIGVILFCFVYTIQVILRQKKLGDIKNDFINNMTHEFKTPIATISLASDAITNPTVAGDPAKVQRFAGIIRQENRRMNSQVEKVLQMAQIDKNEFSLKMSEMDIHEIIQLAVENISLQVEQRDGKIHTSLLAENPVLEADETHVANIIHNLLDNANKYSPDKPDITIRTRNLSNGIQISVEDKGVGISKEARKLIFDKFYRVPTGNLHDIKGFGLGLSYVKAMVTAHGGHIDVKSELDKGSCFEVFLPFKSSGGAKD